MPCSIKEPGLYDYVIFNDDLEDAFAQLVLVAKRALSGKQATARSPSPARSPLWPRRSQVRHLSRLLQQRYQPVPYLYR